MLVRLQQVLLFLSIGFPIVLGYFDDEGFHGPFNDRHHTPAFEDNVFSQGYDEPAVPFTDAPGASPFSNDDTDSSACLTNQDGFGGSIGTNIFTVNYAYEMELKSNRIDTLETIIFKLERNVADFFLQSTDFSNVPCRRQLRQKLAHLPEPNDSRRLVPVGLSINPRDQVNTQISCAEDPSNGNECKFVDGAFQVYTVNESDEDEKLPDTLLDKLEVAMNNGDFDTVHESIVKVTYVDPPATASDGGSQLNSQTPNAVRSSNSSGPNSSVIIGASVGALLILGGLVFYKRRQRKDDTDANTDALNSGMV